MAEALITCEAVIIVSSEECERIKIDTVFVTSFPAG
jgi:hypothetical protein